MESIVKNREVLFQISIAIQLPKQRRKRNENSIVEDEAVWRDKIQTIIEKYCRDKNISSKINSYNSGKDFLKNADAICCFWILNCRREDGF